MAVTGFKKEILERIKQELIKLGFKRNAHGTFYKELNAEQQIFSVITISTYHGKVRTKDAMWLNPQIGVSCKLFSELRDNVMGIKMAKLLPPTIVTPLGYLTPKKTFIQWCIENGKDNESVIAEIINNIVAYGFPYQNNRNTLDLIIDEVIETSNGAGQRSSALPLLYYCNGEKQKGLDFINKCSDDDKYFMAFVEKYKELK